MKKQCLHISLQEDIFKDPIAQSRGIPVFASFPKNEFVFTIINFKKLSDSNRVYPFWKSVKIRNQDNIKILTVPKISFPLDFIVATFLSLFVIFNERINILYFRDHWTALLGDLLRKIRPKVKVVYHNRGLPAEESVMKGHTQPGSLKFEFLKRTHSFVIKTADMVICVSQKMAEDIQVLKPHGLVIVIPNYVDTNIFFYSKQKKENVKEKLGLSDRLVIIYSGGASVWQCPEEMIDIFRLICELDESAFFLVLTHQPSLFENILSCSPLTKDQWRILSLPYSKVPDYLNAGDIGFMLRKDSLVNRVSCPVKFAEYLSSGIPVLTTPGVGDLSDLVVTHQIGAILTNISDRESRKEILEFLKLYKENPDEISQRCHACAKQFLSSDSVLPKYIQYLRKLALQH